MTNQLSNQYLLLYLHIFHTKSSGLDWTCWSHFPVTHSLAISKTLAQFREVLLSRGLACPVSGLLGDVQMSGGVVVGRLRLPHGAVSVTQRPAGSPLSNLAR